MTRLVPVLANVQSDIPVGVEQGSKYVFVGPDGTRAVFNDRSDIDHVGFLTAPPSGFDSPDVRQSSDLIVEGDGAVHGAFYFGARPWTLEGIIDPEPDARRDFSEVLTETRRNLATNPGVRVAGGYLPDGGSTLSYFTSGGPTTPAGGYIRATATATPTTRVGPLVGTMPVPPGPTDILFAAYFYSAVTSRRAVFYFDWLDSTGAIITTTLGGAKDVGATPIGSWARFTYSSAVPPGAASVNFYLFAQAATGNVAASEVHQFSGVQMSPGASDPGYFDGGTAPGGTPLRSAWVGAADASISVLYNVTRPLWNAAQVTNRRINTLQRASKAMRANAQLQWTPTGGVGVRLLGRRGGFRITDRLPKRFLLSMESAERRIEAQIVRSLSAAGAASIVGRNDGNANASPIITLRDSWLNPVLTNNATGEQLRLTLSMIAGDTTIIDVKARTITKNGANAYSSLQFPASAWWELLPGDNTVVPTGVGAGGTWQIDSRDAWE